MKTRTLVATGALLLTLAGCLNPTRPEVAAADPALPLDKAMDAAIKKDKFLTEYMRPGFYRAEDGAVESYIPDPEDGAPALAHVAKLATDWCSRNGGRMEGYPEIPVLERGVGTVIQLRENAPVAGQGYNLICYRNREPIAATAIGRNTFFLNTTQIRQAIREAGASIVNLR